MIDKLLDTKNSFFWIFSFQFMNLDFYFSSKTWKKWMFAFLDKNNLIIVDQMDYQCNWCIGKVSEFERNWWITIEIFTAFMECRNWWSWEKNLILDKPLL